MTEETINVKFSKNQNLRKMTTTTERFKPLEIEWLIEGTTNYIMTQNAGIGLCKMKNALGFELDEITALNKEVNEIMLNARKAINAKLTRFIKERY